MIAPIHHTKRLLVPPRLHLAKNLPHTSWSLSYQETLHVPVTYHAKLIAYFIC